MWWRRQNVAYGSNEVYVDIVETVSCTCNGMGSMVSGGVSGEILMNSKLSGVPEAWPWPSRPCGGGGGRGRCS